MRSLRRSRRKKGKVTEHQEADIVALCDEMMEIAFERNASDIHIDPEENIVLVQLRVDGVLETLRKLPKSIHNALISRFKVLVADGHRRAADGPGRPVLSVPGSGAAADSHADRDAADDARRAT